MPVPRLSHLQTTDIAAASEPQRPSVLHVFKVYYPDLFGGTLSVIRDICAGLRERFKAKVLVCSKSTRGITVGTDGTIVERVSSFGDLFSLPIAPTFPWRLWRRIADHDLIALHAPFPLADLVFALGLGRARPLVVHWHADIVSHQRLRPLVEPLMRRTLQRADAIIVSDVALIGSSSLLREFSRKCHVVPFGINVARYDTVQQTPPCVEAGKAVRPVVLACGRLVPYKGFDVLLRAVAGRNCSVWIIGEGRERARLEQMITELGLEASVRLIGAVADHDLAAYLKAADVFVLPSVTDAETFGIAQLEAMAAGLPIVNTALDTAVPQVARHGLEAITVRPGDAEKLADAIDTLLADAALRQRLGAAARQRAVETYSLQAFHEGIQSVYRRTIASRQSRISSAPNFDLGRLGQAVRIAAALAWSDMRHRYVRSLLGPFWMSLQMAITVAVLGSVIGHFSNGSAVARLPMLALSLTAWTFLNGVVLDATTALQNAASLVKDRALPPIAFLLQCCFRQGLFALHNACVPFILWLLITPKDFSGTLLALPGLLAFVVCVAGLGLVLGTIATRFRDMKPIIESSMMLAFLSSPVVWTTDMLDQASPVIRLNPLTHLFAVWREPLTTGHVGAASALYVVICLVVLSALSALTLSFLRKSAFWI